MIYVSPAAKSQPHNIRIEFTTRFGNFPISTVNGWCASNLLLLLNYITPMSVL